MCCDFKVVFWVTDQGLMDGKDLLSDQNFGVIKMIFYKCLFHSLISYNLVMFTATQITIELNCMQHKIRELKKTAIALMCTRVEAMPAASSSSSLLFPLQFEVLQTQAYISVISISSSIISSLIR